MNNRTRTQKKIYTPTTTNAEPESFLCQIIETGESVIVNRSSMKRVYDDTAEIMVYGRRMEATIEYRGTRNECRRVWEKREEALKLNNFDEPNNHESEEDDLADEQMDILKISSTSKISTKTRTPQQKGPPPDSVVKIHHRSSALHPAKKTIPNALEEEDIQILGVGGLSDEENDNQILTPSSARSIIKHFDVALSSVRQENEKQFIQLSKKIDRKHHMNSIDLSSFREPGHQNQTYDDVMHNGNNLLYIRGKSIGDYGRQVLRALYSQEELLKSILPPGGTQYARPPLDTQRFERLHDALRAKYHIATDRYEDFFTKLVRPKLVDFLSDERKRDRKSQSTQSSISSSPGHSL